MIDFGSTSHTIAQATVFPDHADIRRFYALTDTPHVRVGDDGSPRFSLVLLRAAPSMPGGGLFEVELEAGLDAETRAEIARELAPSGGDDLVITDAPWIAGTASLIGFLGQETAGAEGLVTTRLGSARPSLAGHPRVVLGAGLSEAGAALLRGALAGDGLPAAVLFDLEALALMGPLGVEVDVDLKMAHERFAIGGYLKTPYGRAEIRKVWEELVEAKVVRVRVLDASGDREAARAEGIRRASEEATMRLFQASLTPESFEEGKAATGAAVRLGFRLTSERDSLEATATYSYRERRAVRFHHYPQASLVNLLHGLDPSRVVREVDAESAFFQSATIVVRTEDDLRERGVSSLIVRLTWEGKGGVLPLTRETVLTPSNREASIVVAKDPREPYSIVVERAARDGQGPPRLSEPRLFSGRFVVIDLDEHFPVQTLTVIAGHIDFGWIAEVLVHALDPNGKPLATAVLEGVSASARLSFEPQPTLLVRSTFVGREGEPTWAVEEDPGQNDAWIVDAPFGADLGLLLAVAPSDDLDFVSFELLREEPAHGFRHARTVTIEGPDFDAVRTTLHRMSDADAAYEVRITRTYLDGRVEMSDWEKSERTVVLVAEPGLVARRVELALLRGSPRQMGAILVDVTVIPLDDDGVEVGKPARARIGADEAGGSVVLAVPEAWSGHFRMDVTTFPVEGGTTSSTVTGKGVGVIP